MEPLIWSIIGFFSIMFIVSLFQPKAKLKVLTASDETELEQLFSEKIHSIEVEEFEVIRRNDGRITIFVLYK